MAASQQARDAVRAAKHRRSWGYYATFRFVLARGCLNETLAAIAFEERRKSCSKP